MKKLILLLLLAIIFISCSGCKNKRINIDKEAEKQCHRIIECFSSNDADGLKNMFCKTIASGLFFDKKLRDALDFFDGKVVSYDIDPIIGTIESIDWGRQVMVDVRPDILNIKTDSGQTYKIWFGSYLINVDEPDHQGIYELTIERSDGEKYTLGNYYAVH